jgi:hypothetical protein
MKLELEIKTTYTVNGQEFDSKQEAQKTMAMKDLNVILEGGVQSVIENRAEFIRLLKIVSGSSTKGVVMKGGNGTLKMLKELLEGEGHDIERDGLDWPVYHLTLNDGSHHKVRYTGKVWQLYNLYNEGNIYSLLEYEIK